MKKILAILFALLAPFSAQAQQSKATLQSEIATDFADNTSNAITAALLRSVTSNIVSSYVDWLTCTTSGSMIYYVGGTPTCLAPGASGTVLGGGTVPAWTAATGVTVGTTTITSGTTTRILYDNAGVLGEYTLSGSGTAVAMANSPSLITPALGVATGTSLALGGATIGSNALAVTGPVLFNTALAPASGGTGVNNGGNTITVSGSSLVVVPQSSGCATWTTGTLSGQSCVARLPNPGNLYVATAPNGGSDSNSCLSGFPCLTIQHAANVGLGSYDFQGSNILINVGAGTFAGATVSGPNPGGGSASLVIVGAGASNTLINSTIIANAYANVRIGSMKIAVSSGSDVLVENYSTVTLYDGGMNFGAATTALVDTVNSSTFNGNSNFGFTISGGAQFGFLISTNSNVQLSVGATYTLTGTPAFSNCFVDAIDGSGFNPGTSSAFSGSATGTQYCLAVNSWIDMENITAALPGNVAGTVAWGSSFYATNAVNNIGIGNFVLQMASSGELNLGGNELTLSGSGVVIAAGSTGTWPNWNAGTLSGTSSTAIANAAAPSAPSSGSDTLWTDSTDLRFHDINSAGAIGTTAVAKGATTHQWFNAMSSAGIFSASQPAFSDLSGSIAATQMPAFTGDCTTSAGAVATTCLKTNGVAFTAGATAAAGQLPGTATNDDACAGCVGEYPSSTIASGSAVSLSNGTPANLTSLSLTAGDWDVDVVCNFAGASTTLVTTLACGVSTTTGTFDNTLGRDALTYVSSGAAALYNAIVGGFPPPTVGVFRRRFSLATATTVFGVAGSQFSTSTSSVYGYMNARRAR